MGIIKYLIGSNEDRLTYKDDFELRSIRSTTFSLNGITGNVPQIIPMDAPVGTPTDPFMIDGSGLLEINQFCKCEMSIRTNSGRNTTTNQSLLLGAVEKNGVITYDDSIMISYLNENTNYRGESGDGIITGIPGDTYQFKIWTDTINDEDSELYAAPNNTFGLNMPSLIITVKLRYLIEPF